LPTSGSLFPRKEQEKHRKTVPQNEQPAEAPPQPPVDETTNT
jgi:hypothetical protein